VLAIAVMAVLLVASSSSAAPDTTVEKGSDYADVETEGWVSGFEKDDEVGTFNLTLGGLPEARVTIDDLVRINASSPQTFQATVTSALSSEANVTVRFWTGDTPPDEDADACIVANVSKSGTAPGQCEAEVLDLQYATTLPGGYEGSSSFTLDIERVTGSGGGGGGGASPTLASSAVAEAERPTWTHQPPPRGRPRAWSSRLGTTWRSSDRRCASTADSSTWTGRRRSKRW